MGCWGIRVVLRRITPLLLAGHIDPKDGRAVGAALRRPTPCRLPRRTAGIGALPPPAGQAETFLERPVFGVKRPFSNAWGIRGARGGQISIQRRRRDAEPVCDLSHADVGIGEHRLGGLDVVVSCAL